MDDDSNKSQISQKNEESTLMSERLLVFCPVRIILANFFSGIVQSLYNFFSLLMPQVQSLSCLFLEPDGLKSIQALSLVVDPNNGFLV